MSDQGEAILIHTNTWTTIVSLSLSYTLYLSHTFKVLIINVLIIISYNQMTFAIDKNMVHFKKHLGTPSRA